MKQFLYDYSDLCALIGTFLLPLWFTIRAKQAAGRSLRAIAAYFFFFSPLGSLTFISFHLLENSYRAVDAYVAGTFVYDFHFYSLELLGVVVFVIALSLLKASRQYATTGLHLIKYFRLLGLLLLVSLPLIPIAPIAAVPGMVSLISLIALPLLRRKQKAVSKTLAVAPQKELLASV